MGAQATGKRPVQGWYLGGGLVTAAPELGALIQLVDAGQRRAWSWIGTGSVTGGVGGEDLPALEVPRVPALGLVWVELDLLALVALFLPPTPALEPIVRAGADRKETDLLAAEARGLGVGVGVGEDAVNMVIFTDSAAAEQRFGFDVLLAKLAADAEPESNREGLERPRRLSGLRFPGQKVLSGKNLRFPRGRPVI